MSLYTYFFSLYDRIGFAYIGRVGSVAVTVSISLERYLNCCHSTQDFAFKSLLVPIPICFAFIYNIPKFFEMRSCTNTENEMLQNISTSMTTSTNDNESADEWMEMTTNKTFLDEVISEKTSDTTTNLLSSNFNVSLASDESLIKTRMTNSTPFSDLSTFLFSSTESTNGLVSSSSDSFIEDNIETSSISESFDLDACEGGYQTTELRNSSWYIIYYVFWSKFLLVEIIPWISVIVLTILTSQKIKQFQANRNRLLGNTSRHTATRGLNDEGI